MQSGSKPLSIDSRLFDCGSNLNEVKALSQASKAGKDNCRLRPLTWQRKPNAKGPQRLSVHQVLGVEVGVWNSFIITLISTKAEIDQVI